MHAMKAYKVRGALTTDIISAHPRGNLLVHWKGGQVGPRGEHVIKLTWNLSSSDPLNQFWLDTNQFGSLAQWRTRIISKPCYNCCFIFALKIPKPGYYSGRNYFKNLALLCKIRKFSDALNAHSRVGTNIQHLPTLLITTKRFYITSSSKIKYL